MSDATESNPDALVEGQRVATPHDMESSATATDDAATGAADDDVVEADVTTGTTPDASGDGAASARTQDEIDRSEGYA